MLLFCPKPSLESSPLQNVVILGGLALLGETHFLLITKAVTDPWLLIFPPPVLFLSFSCFFWFASRESSAAAMRGIAAVEQTNLASPLAAFTENQSFNTLRIFVPMLCSSDTAVWSLCFIMIRVYYEPKLMCRYCMYT